MNRESKWKEHILHEQCTHSETILKFENQTSKNIEQVHASKKQTNNIQDTNVYECDNDNMISWTKNTHKHPKKPVFFDVLTFTIDFSVFTCLRTFSSYHLLNFVHACVCVAAPCMSSHHRQIFFFLVLITSSSFFIFGINFVSLSYMHKIHFFLFYFVCYFKFNPISTW